MYEPLRTKPRYLRIILNFSPKMACGHLSGRPLESGASRTGDGEVSSPYCSGDLMSSEMHVAAQDFSSSLGSVEK